MSYVSKVVINSAYSWVNLLISLIISFFLSPFVLHRIGNVHFGVWALISQITGYLWLLDFGVRDSIVKYVAEYHAKQDNVVLSNVISSSLKMYSLISFACIVFSAALAILFPYFFRMPNETLGIARTVIIITGFGIAQAFIFNVFIGILMGLQRFDVFSKINIVTSIVRAILFVQFLTHGYGLVTICLIQFLCDSCLYVVAWRFSRKLLPLKLNLRAKYRGTGTYRMLISYSFFVFLNMIGIQAIFNSSNFIIAIFLPVSSVTFFAIASSLVEYMKKIILAGTQVLTPLISELEAKNDFSKVRSILINGTKYSLLLGLPMACVYLFLGKQFIGLWMGADYAETSGTILIILCLSTLFSLPHYTVSGILLGVNKHRILALLRIIEAMGNVGLSILLTNFFGLLGTTFGTAIPHLIIVVIVLPLVISKIVEIRIIDYLRNAYYGPLLASLPFAFACFIASSFYISRSLLSFFCEVAVLLPIYVVGAWLLGLTDEDHKFFKRILLSIVPASLGRKI